MTAKKYIAVITNDSPRREAFTFFQQKDITAGEINGI